MSNRVTGAVLSQEELAAIRERAEKATEGLWRVDYGRTDNDRAVTTDRYEMIGEYFTLDDADFIAHARQDVPKLLAEIERLQERLEYAQAVVDLLYGGDSE